MEMVKIKTLTFEESWKASPGRSDSSHLQQALLNACQSIRRDPQPVDSRENSTGGEISRKDLSVKS